MHGHVLQRQRQKITCPPILPSLAGMPVVLNQLLSDRRPAAQALLRELLLNADGTLRSDATTQQILQVGAAFGALAGVEHGKGSFAHL